MIMKRSPRFSFANVKIGRSYRCQIDHGNVTSMTCPLTGDDPLVVT